MKKKKAKWSSNTKKLAKELHSELSINNHNWHEFKTDSERRSAELLVCAISQIVNEGETSEVEELINQALLWIKKEIKDPGCPSH